MGKMSEGKKAELSAKYGDNALPLIKSRYYEQAVEKSARYILFANKDNKHGFCEKCFHDVTFDKTKHKSKATCPNCGTELTIQHTWIKKKCEWNVDWYVVGELVDEETFALRYISVEQNKDFTKTAIENAREIYDFKNGNRYFFSRSITGWNLNDRYYFTEFVPCTWVRRKACCIGAESLNNICEELKGLSALKYFEQLREYFKVYVYPRDNVFMLMDACLYEKLEKVGLSELSMEHYKNYVRNSHDKKMIKFNRNETSLVKMLNIDKTKYKLLLKSKDVGTCRFVIENPGIDASVMDFLIANNAISRYEELCRSEHVDNVMKSLRYVLKKGISAYEYTHYLNLMGLLNYKLDDSYRYPKDFYKADDRVNFEYLAMTNPTEYKRKKKQDRLIKKISDGLRKMPDIQEFFKGSDGLLVYVPESARELADQGKLLHNCIGSYVDVVAEGKTLVFFVRRIEAPDEAFVAFEYVNGEVVQCRYDYNEKVEDDKIISFVEAFAERLRKNNVLYKAA